MKKNINQILGSNLFLIVCVFGAMFGMSSCNKEFNNVLPQDFKNDTLGRSAGKKVLYIILDGVKGSEVQTLAPRNITLLDRKATYSFEALADDGQNVITDASAWTTMITGVGYQKHGVTTNDFNGLDLQATPTIFTRIKNNVKNGRTASFASVSIFNDKLAADATVKATFATDAGVKDAAVNEIKTNNPNLVVAQFHSAEAAALQGGYSATNNNYAQAITGIDGYIGELLTALKSRVGYASEDWLIIIASNKGGNPNGTSTNAFNDPSRNIYMAYYSPKFISKKITQPDPNSYPFAGTAPNFSSKNIAVQTNNAIGNFGSSGEFTYMYKMRDDNSGGQYYPSYMGKRRDFYNVNAGNNPGWSFLFGGNEAQFDFAGRPGFGITINDGKWHTIAFTIRVVNGTRTVSLYVDGVNAAGYNFGGNLDNNFFLTLGSDEQGQNVTILLRDIALFNVGMTKDEIAATMRKQLAVGDQFYDKLIGYWPGDETSGTIMYDKVGGNNFIYSTGMQFTSFSEISPNISPSITPETYRAVPNAVDAPLLIYSWLKIAVPAQWGLDGRLIIPAVDLPTN